LLRDAHLGSIWEGTGNIVALDTLKRAVGRHGAEAALGADLHARIDEAASIPQGWRDRLRNLTDKAIGFAREVAARSENEAEARRATSALYHAASAVTFAWEGSRVHAMRGDARRLLLSRLVVDHRLTAQDPFAVLSDGRDDAIADRLLGDRPVAMADAADMIGAA
jgi:hypothetical protein